MIDIEVWLPANVDGFEDLYQVSSHGKVWSNRYKNYLKPYINPSLPDDYYTVGFWKNGKKNGQSIHVLVALTFLEFPDGDGKYEVNHMDGDKRNNNVTNLEWGTHKHNMEHARDVLGVRRNSVHPHKDKVYYDTAPEGISVPGYPNYILTPEGHFFSLHSMFYLEETPDHSGYVSVKLSHKGKTKKHYNHITTAKLYCHRPPNKNFVNHIDRNRRNNAADNLEWLTRAENMQHAVRTGVRTSAKKTARLDINGNVLQVYNSATEASKDMKISKESICYACRVYGRRSNGFLWKYV